MDDTSPRWAMDAYARACRPDSYTFEEKEALAKADKARVTNARIVRRLEKVA